MTPEAKAMIRRAAALAGLDEASFVTEAALERARATIADHAATLVGRDDWARLAAALDAAAEPSDALREAYRLHRAMSPDGG